jgi:hypothetical protein
MFSIPFSESRLLKILTFFVVLFSFSLNSFSQCPVIEKRNNGNGNASQCLTSWDGDNCPAGYTFKTGDFSFTTGSTTANYSVLRVLRNGLLIQEGNQLRNGNTAVWFGGYNGTTKDLCFYGTSNSSPIPPAANYTFYFQNLSTNAVLSPCSYVVTEQNGTSGVSNFSSGTISSDQTICTGSTPATLTGSVTTGCTGQVTYQWQASTLTATDGYVNASGASASQNYSPGTLTQTTYFQRLATCPDGGGITSNSNYIVITVNSAGTISPSTGYSWNASTTSPTFTVSGATAGGIGTWTSSNTNVATIGSTSGILSAVAAGSTTIMYSLLSGGITCTTTRAVTITDIGGVLPVNWQSVTAEKLSARVLVRWVTATEQNTRDFEVQFSTNAIDWLPIGTMPAAGRSEVAKEYSLLHKNPQKGGISNFYRILQRDLDGKVSYSKIVSIIMDAPGPDVMIFPNPASEILTLFIAEPQTLRLVNTSGANVWQAALTSGRHQVSVSHLPSGVYFLLTTNGPQRVVIQ